jgi:hypothetical protein
MGGHPFLKITCPICSEPVDLTVDLCTDENGKAVHENCYAKHIASSHHTPPNTMVAD